MQRPAPVCRQEAPNPADSGAFSRLSWESARPTRLADQESVGRETRTSVDSLFPMLSQKNRLAAPGRMCEFALNAPSPYRFFLARM